MNRLVTSLSSLFAAVTLAAQSIPVPSPEVLQRPFCEDDLKMFENPDKVFYPEVWVDCLCGNLSKEGILADLESIKEAGFSGVQMFFGNRGGAWPGVKQILSLSPEWEEFVQYAAQQAHRLGLRFTLQNCPGWAMAGGPWITPDKAMRHLVWTTTHATASSESSTDIILPAPEESSVDWRDYHDLMVLAFPTPLGEGEELKPVSISPQMPPSLAPTTPDKPYVFDIVMDSDAPVRTVEFSSVQLSNHWFCYDPGISASMEAVYPDGTTSLMFKTEWPQSNWQDDRPLSIACDEVKPTKNYRLTIANIHGGMGISSLRFLSSARKNGWESEAAWCLRSIMRNNDSPLQDKASWVDGVVDLTEFMDESGKLDTDLPDGNWTFLRIGNVNTGKKNAPAPPEATGFECDKFSTVGADSHFAGYIGRLGEGPLNGLLDGMLMDSWECETQTWTPLMEEEFRRVAGYDLRPWLPALMGYVVRDPEQTARFLRDWRATVNDLVVNKFYGRMAELAHKNGLSVTYETAGGDVFPSDIMEYFKHADIPMCEFWVHDPEIFVGTFNFKPIRPTASAGHLYGKPRIAAEAYTSMQQTWDEQLSTLRETANKNLIHGATYLIYQAYSHNPAPGRLVPGSSFGDGIGTPFLRSQTWWSTMGDFNDCAARTSFLLERGLPVVDVLWYLGDEIDHKPNQDAPFPSGYKYDYCNPDVLLNRLSVDNGDIVTPEGIRYKLLWIPQAYRFLPETLEKLVELLNAGATIVGEAPIGLATLKDPQNSQRRYDSAVQTLWGSGKVISGKPLDTVLEELSFTPDLGTEGGEVQWLHRRADGADIYFICAQTGGSFSGTIFLRGSGCVELWKPIDGSSRPVASKSTAKGLSVDLSLERGETCFLVVRPSVAPVASEYVATQESSLTLDRPWRLTIPAGWGMDEAVTITSLKPLKDLEIPQEAKAFSGTMTYSSSFNVKHLKGRSFTLDLGTVCQIARVTINGHVLRPLWTAPYSLDVTSCLKKGRNEISIEVTNTWFNRLAFDSSLPEDSRKTWTTNYPVPGSPLRDSGLLGPVKLLVTK